MIRNDTPSLHSCILIMFPKVSFCKVSEDCNRKVLVKVFAVQRAILTFLLHYFSFFWRQLPLDVVQLNCLPSTRKIILNFTLSSRDDLYIKKQMSRMEASVLIHATFIPKFLVKKTRNSKTWQNFAYSIPYLLVSRT